MTTRALRSIAGPLALAAALLAAPATNARDKLVIANWGGIFEESLEKNVLESFRKTSDTEIVIHRQSSAADTLTKIRAEKNAPTIDVAFTTWAGAQSLAKEGLAEELTSADAPQIADIFPKLVGTLNSRVYWIGINPKSRGFAIRNDVVKVPSEMTVKWLLDPSLKRQIAVPQFGWGNGAILLALAMSSGGGVNNTEPGFELAKKFAPNVNVIYRTTGEAVRLVSTGEAAIAYVNSNAAANLVQKGVKVGFYLPKDTPLFLDADAIMVVKGGPNGKAAAIKFVRYFLTPERLNGYSFGTGSSSPNAKAPAPPADKVPFPFDPTLMASAFFPSGDLADSINKNFDAWNERWTRDVIPLFGK